MKTTSVLKSIIFIVLLHLSNTLFCQDTIYRLNKPALIGIVKHESAESVHISVFKNGRIKEKIATKDRIISIKRGNTNGYFVFDTNGELNKTAFKKKEKKNWKSLKEKEKRSPDTLALIDRKSKNRMFVGVKYDSLEGNQLYYRKPGRTKVTAMELEKIYSVNYSSKKPPLVLYIQDTLEGNWYTAEQMKDYMHGQNDAYRNYKRKARASALGGFVLGIASSGTGLIAGPLLVIGITSLKGYSKPKFKTKFGYDENFRNNEYYKEGFGTMAKRLTITRVAVTTLSGLIVGYTGLTYLLN
jgi:hypothetical protein